MLGKLVKNELKSYRFSFGIVFLSGFVFTIFMKVVCMLPYQEGVKELIQSLGFMAYYYLIMLVGVAANVLIIIRFYSTMVGDRGYLTWTLPAKSSTILWAKLIGGGLWEILAAIVTYIYLAIFYAGHYWVDSMTEEMTVMFRDLFDSFEPQDIVIVILAVIAIFIWSFVPILLIYLCMAIGQLFGKWRILASIGCYFVIIILIEIVMVLGIVVLSLALVDVSPDIFLIDLDAYTVINGVLVILAILGAGAFAALFAITNSLFKKHLNLE